MARKKRTNVAEDGPHPIDVHVGARVRLRRTYLGISQEKLGDALGLTFQQVQKYERGTNRIGSSRLYEISKALDVPVSFFFDDMDQSLNQAIANRVSGLAENAPPFETDPMGQKETIDLVRAYYRIPDAQARKSIIEMIRSFAASLPKEET